MLNSEGLERKAGVEGMPSAGYCEFCACAWAWAWACAWACVCGEGVGPSRTGLFEWPDMDAVNGRGTSAILGLVSEM